MLAWLGLAVWNLRMRCWLCYSRSETGTRRLLTVTPGSWQLTWTRCDRAKRPASPDRLYASLSYRSVILITVIITNVMCISEHRQCLQNAWLLQALGKPERNAGFWCRWIWLQILEPSSSNPVRLTTRSHPLGITTTTIRLISLLLCSPSSLLIAFSRFRYVSSHPLSSK